MSKFAEVIFAPPCRIYLFW